MFNWRFWRFLVILIAAATAFFLVGGGSLIGYEIDYQLIKGVSIKTVLAIANGISVYALWKEL